MDFTLAESIWYCELCRDKWRPYNDSDVDLLPRKKREPANHSMGESEASTMVAGWVVLKKEFYLAMLDDEGAQDDLRPRCVAQASWSSLSSPL